ncbi:MAG: FKBP-type peptidyl-prolyl cis-trans isomerase [Bacteroidetes bacterium]|nr:FKBP-type peptidyl-prolyl cis-trans isomerase [Bacteroidota bacterium]
MKLLKNKWFWISLAVLLATLGVLFGKNISILFGGYQKSELGYSYRFLKGGKSDSIRGTGYYCVYEYAWLAANGDTIENGMKTGVQQVRPYPQKVNSFIDEAMRTAGPESVMEVLVPVDSLLLHDPDNLKLTKLKSGTNTKFYLHTFKILNSQQYEKYHNERYIERVVKENNQIDAFAAKKTDVKWYLDSVKWFKYYIINANNKPRFDVGDPVEFHYEIYKLNGEIIQSSLGGRKMKITVAKDDDNFPAFDFIVRYLGEGESGFFLVTSDYGYGENGFLDIVKPYTPLAVKLTDVKMAKP